MGGTGDSPIMQVLAEGAISPFGTLRYSESVPYTLRCPLRMDEQCRLVLRLLCPSSRQVR